MTDAEAQTLPVHVQSLPVRTLRVKVTKGPDAGVEKTFDGERFSLGTAMGNDITLTDPTVSRFHAELLRRSGEVVIRDLGSTNGTVVREGRLRDGDLTVKSGASLSLGQTELQLSDGEVVMRAPQQGQPDTAFLGRSASVRAVLASAHRVAASDASVLLLGESGTGKELLAREIHRHSPRAQRPFVVVDCGALTPSLFVSELFGHEKGAFTGADARHEGAFERAAGGTLLLDEVGELPPAVQVALLGALERRMIRRVGGRTDVPIDVRVLAATHRNLRAQVNAGTFRLDLFYRLAVVSLELPALRDRREDIRPLLEHFLKLVDAPKPFDELFAPEVLARLERHDWPGNVRELRNVVVSTVALGGMPESAPMSAVDPSDTDAAGALQSYREARAALVREFERTYLTALLKRTSGNVRQAARDAHMDRSYLIELLKRHGLG